MKMLTKSIVQWFDAYEKAPASDAEKNQIDWLRVVPFIFLHLACFATLWTGVSLTALLIALFMYAVRIFSIGAFYHRYFSHKTYKTNRIWQFIFAVLGATSVQRGPIWWSAHHRSHHLCSDQPKDVHSPVQHSFFMSHMGWFLTKGNFNYDKQRVQDWLKFPEIIFLDRFDILVPVILASLIFLTGHLLYLYAPSLHTSGFQLLIWGFFISTVVAFHVTVSINSLGHRFGKRPYDTEDNSRNNWLLALLTFGEGWHNNHHRYPATAQQGFQWWQFDLTFYMLRVMERIGVISELRYVPQKVLYEARNAQHEST